MGVANAIQRKWQRWTVGGSSPIFTASSQQKMDWPNYQLKYLYVYLFNRIYIYRYGNAGQSEVKGPNSPLHPSKNYLQNGLIKYKHLYLLI